MNLKRMAAALLTLAILLSLAAPAMAETESKNPLVTPQTVEYVETEDEFFNVLLLGIEMGFEGYWQSDWANKPTIRECHTDVVMVLSFNKTQQTINVISIPRDTLVYVPGVHGLYKINAAFNLAETNEEGFENVRNTVSWFLGGIRIDAYCAVDMTGYVALGDLMDGLDFYVDMTYTGGFSRQYYMGNQHLDGMGIMDYSRARKNATVDNDDLGRNRRCRAIIVAIIEKLRDDLDMVKKLWDLSQSGDFAFFTDLTLDDVLTMWNAVRTYNAKIGNYGINGYYGDGGLGWFFNYTYQSERQDLLKTVFGINADPLPYVGINYTRWMPEKGGFLTAHNLRQAKLIMDYARTIENPTKAMTSALEQLEAAYDVTVTAFDKTTETMEEMDRLRMMNARKEMEGLADTVAKLFGYPNAVVWTVNSENWDLDPLINDYYNLNWN